MERTIVSVEIQEVFKLQPREGVLLLAMDAQGYYLLEGFVSARKMKAEFLRTLLTYYEDPGDGLARIFSKRDMTAESVRQIGVVYPKDPEVERYYVFAATDARCLNTQGLLRIDMETLLLYIEARVLQRPEDLQALKIFLKK